MNSMLAQTRLFGSPWAWAPLAVAMGVLLALGILVIYFARIYLRALLSGAKVTFTELIALRLRHRPSHQGHWQERARSGADLH